MPHKNDDLENLFKKAARGYPLRTDSADWENLASKLEKSKKIAAKKNRLKYSAVFLLLVITIGALSVFKYSPDKNIAQKTTVVSQPQSDIKPENNSAGLTESAAASINYTNSIPGKSEATLENDDYLPYSKYNDVVDAIFPSAATYNFNKSTSVKAFGFLKTINVDELKPDVTRIDNRIVYNSTDEVFNNDETMQADEEADKSSTENTVEKTANKAPISFKQQKKFYGIAYGGPEFSVVKFQKTTSPGYRMGVALGYKINDRFNIELGLQREHIDFYTNGKYVDTSLLRIKRGTNIERLNATGKITSVPLTLRYNFLSNRKGNFFVSGGINAVIITHNEHYDYEISKDGVEGSLSKKYSALTNPKYFSGFSISAGYQTKVYGTWSMKIEPYYQAPVKDFGVAKTPVSNFGVDIGIVKDLK